MLGARPGCSALLVPSVLLPQISWGQRSWVVRGSSCLTQMSVVRMSDFDPLPERWHRTAQGHVVRATKPPCCGVFFFQ